MPRGDRRGPLGMGSMTGRAAGYCAGYPAPGYANPVFGRGFGFGRGGGRGRCNGLYGTGPRGWGYGGYGLPRYAGYDNMPYQPRYASEPSRLRELDTLKGQAEYFDNALTDIRNRIAELEKENTER